MLTMTHLTVIVHLFHHARIRMAEYKPITRRRYWDGKRLIETSKPRPLRVFVNDNEFDLGWGGNCPAWVDKEVGNTTAEYFLGAPRLSLFFPSVRPSFLSVFLPPCRSCAAGHYR